MPSHFILHQFTECDIAEALTEVSQLALDRYDNPFEQKDFLANKADMLEKPALSWALDELRGTTKIATQLLNLPIAYPEWRHYGGLFVYKPGDHLSPHVDAGIHPLNKDRKVATICLYLTDAVLSFWQGDPCTESDPEVWLEQPVLVRAGEAILFANHDQAWHSVPVVSGRPRVCLTLSYMASPDFKHSRYQNPRTRAYFARRYGFQDSPEMAVLRQQRASEDQHQEVYRVGDTGDT